METAAPLHTHAQGLLLCKHTSFSVHFGGAVSQWVKPRSHEYIYRYLLLQVVFCRATYRSVPGVYYPGITRT